MISELIAKCNKEFRSELNLLPPKPASTKFTCFGDEVYVVCMGDYIYVMNRREGLLKRPENSYELMFVLRNYAPDIVKHAAPEFKQWLANTLKKIHDPPMLHVEKIRGSLYIGGGVIEFDTAAVFSDAPCVVYLLMGQSLVGYVDFTKCSDLDKACVSAYELLKDVVFRAVEFFEKSTKTDNTSRT